MRNAEKNVWFGNLKEANQFEKFVVDRKLVLRTCLVLERESTDWINLAQDFVQ